MSTRFFDNKLQFICTDVVNADVLPGYKTDHSLFTININTNSNPRGPGLWKLNTSLLSEQEYVELVNQTISP